MAGYSFPVTLRHLILGDQFNEPLEGVVMFRSWRLEVKRKKVHKSRDSAGMVYVFLVRVVYFFLYNSYVFMSQYKKKISYKIIDIYLHNRVYNSAWKYLHFLRFQDMNLKKSAISQACSWHSPFKGCMFDG